MKVTIQQKIAMCLNMVNMNQKQLAEKLGCSPQALSSKIKTGKFSDEDFENIANALGCEYRSGFYWADGRKVE